MGNVNSYLQSLVVTNPLRESTLRSVIQALDIPQGSRGLDAGSGSRPCCWLKLSDPEDTSREWTFPPTSYRTLSGSQTNRGYRNGFLFAKGMYLVFPSNMIYSIGLGAWTVLDTLPSIPCQHSRNSRALSNPVAA